MMIYKNIYLYLDDERDFVEEINNNLTLVICRSYKEALQIIQNNCDKHSTKIILDLDHDLGSKKTGYDFCKWLVANGWIGKFHCHTMNPVGRKNMQQLLTHYGWKEF